MEIGLTPEAILRRHFPAWRVRRRDDGRWGAVLDSSAGAHERIAVQGWSAGEVAAYMAAVEARLSTGRRG